MILGCTVSGSKCRVYGLGFRVYGLGFMVKGLRLGRYDSNAKSLG
jgi:hypothetical protein